MAVKRKQKTKIPEGLGVIFPAATKMMIKATAEIKKWISVLHKSESSKS